MRAAYAESAPNPKIIRIDLSARKQTREILRDQVVLIKAAIASWRLSLATHFEGLIGLALASYPIGHVSGAGIDYAHVHRIQEILAASALTGRLQARRAAEEAGAGISPMFAESFPNDLPPAKAIEWIKSLPTTTREIWESLFAQKQQAAFFITGIEQREILRVIQGEIQESLREGLTLRQFEDRVRATIENLALTGGRLRNVWHNNVTNAMHAGRDEELARPQVRAVLPYFLFDALIDGVVRPNHAALEGGIAPADWPGWEQYRPMLGFQLPLPAHRTHSRARRANACERRGLGYDAQRSCRRRHRCRIHEDGVRWTGIRPT